MITLKEELDSKIAHLMYFKKVIEENNGNDSSLRNDQCFCFSGREYKKCCRFKYSNEERTKELAEMIIECQRMYA